LPIPEQIESCLHRPSRSVVHWNADPEIKADVLAFADRDLHLRQHVPICLRAIDEIAGGQELNHRRPQAAETVAYRETLANGGIEK